MIDGKYDYFAFISYCWEDDKMASELQKKLEGYKFPTSLREKKPNLPSKIRPIFRDKTDLNGPRLEKALITALESSRFLIVICSPHATQSKWVNRGVQRFIDLGREEDIIPFIVEGEAHADDPKDECFPPALLALKGERAIYGINVNDNGRDAAAVKVVSRMFDVKYDALWDRVLLEQKRKRRFTILGLIAAILLITSVAGYIWLKNSELDERNKQIETQYKELQTKNTQIEQQNKELDSKSDSIANVNAALVVAKDSIQRAYEKLNLSEKNLAKSNAELKESNVHLAEERDNVIKANWRVMENLARIVAAKANELMLEDIEDLTMAARLLLHVTPTSINIMDKPFPEEVEQGLRKVHSLLNRGGKIKISNLCRNDIAGTTSVEESPNGDVVAIEKGHTIDIVTLRNGRSLYTIDTHKGTTFCKFSKDGSSIFTYSADSSAAVWDTYSGEQRLLFKKHSGGVYGVYPPNLNKYYVTFTTDSCYTWDSTGRLLYSAPSPSGASMRGEFCHNDELFSMAGRGETQIMETATGRIINTLKSGNDKRVSCARFSNNSRRVLTGSEDSTATIWDTQTGEKLMSFNLGAYVSDAFFFKNEECVAANGGSPTVYKAWNISSGEELEYPHTTASQRNYYDLNTYGDYVETYETHEEKQDSFLKLEEMVNFTQNSSGNLVAVVGNTCDSILIYSYPTLRMMNALANKNRTASSDRIYFDSSSKIFVSTHLFNNSICMWDMSNGEVFSTKFDKDIDGYVGEACFIEDDKKIAVCVGKKILIYDTFTGKLVATLFPYNVIANTQDHLWTSFIYRLVYDEKRNRVIANIYNQVIIWDAASGKELARRTVSTDCYSRLLIDGDKLITYNSCIQIWDLETMKLERTINQVDDDILDLVQLDDNHLIVCMDNGSIKEVNIQKGMIERELLAAYKFNVQKMDIDCNKKFLITVDGRKNILLFDLRRGSLIDIIPVDGLSYYAEFSRDGKAIFAPTRNGLKIIELKEIDNIINELKIKLGDCSLTSKEKEIYYLE